MRPPFRAPADSGAILRIGLLFPVASAQVLKGSSRLVCIAVANRHPVENSVTVETNCQRRSHPTLTDGATSGNNPMTALRRHFDTRGRSREHIGEESARCRNLLFPSIDLPYQHNVVCCLRET